MVNTESRRSGHYLEMGSTTMLSKYVIIYQKFNTTSYIFLDYTNCKDYFDKGINKSGQYYILKNGAVIQVSCFFLREWTMRLVMIISKLGLTLQDFTMYMLMVFLTKSTVILNQV